MKKANVKLVILLVLTVIVALLILLLPSNAPEAAVEVKEGEHSLTTVAKVGTVAPDFTVKMNNDKDFTLSDFRGRVSLVIFYNSWNPLSIDMFSYLHDSVTTRFVERDLAIIPIARKEELDDVATVAKNYGYSFPVGADKRDTIYEKYATSYFPRYFIIDKNGVVVEATVGFNRKKFGASVELIKDIIENK